MHSPVPSVLVAVAVLFGGGRAKTTKRLTHLILMQPASPAPRLARTLGLVALLATSAASADAQTAYGVDSAGILFSFQLSSPSSISTIGDLGFVPEAIDFRPGTSTLYAFDVAGSQARLYTINLADADATPIGTGFSVSGPFTNPGPVETSYNFSGATSFAFDFNPTTQQTDGSIRIRLVANDGTNLRLHSGTGGIAVVDGAINGLSGVAVSGAAYLNSDMPTMGGSTGLYYIDSAGDRLLFSTPPNNGTVTSVGSLEQDVGLNLGFDIYSGSSSDLAYIVDSTAENVADLYSVDLSTGMATRISGINRDFTGGFAIDQLSAIPEPSSFAAIAGLLGLGWCATRRRRIG